MANSLDDQQTPTSSANSGEDQKLIERFLLLKETVENAKIEMEMIRQTLADKYPEGTRIGQSRLTVSYRASLNVRALTSAYPPDMFPQFYKQNIDIEKVKQHFAPQTIETYKTPPTKVITIK